MGFLSICLSAIGVTADVTTLAQAMHDLLHREESYNARELFARCFRHAVQQKRDVLERLKNPNSGVSVHVSEEQLEKSIDHIESGAFALPTVDTDRVAEVLAPHFRESIVIPGHELGDRKYDAQVQQILIATFQQFISELPLNTASFREIVQSHLSTIVSSQTELREKVDDLCGVIRAIQDTISDEPTTDPTTLQFESARPELRNPFRIVTAENFDHNYQLLARLFKAPSDYNSIRSHDNLVIAGGRGCGKSMILKSLSVTPAVEIERLARDFKTVDQTTFTFKDSQLDYFGVYIKLFRGFFSQYTADSRFSPEAAHVYFQHYFNMILLRALLETIIDVSEPQNASPLLNITKSVEEQVVKEIDTIGHFSLDDYSIDCLIRAIRRQEHHVTQYMNQLRLGYGSERYEGLFTSIDRFLEECCAVLCNSIPDLVGCRIYFLLDEFENLTAFQQKVVNTLAKLRPTSLTLKIATRAGGLRAMDNLQGDAMQFPRDYHYITMDYDVNGRDYKELLVEIANRRLEAEGYSIADIKRLLPDAPPCSPCTSDEVDGRIRQHLVSTGKEIDESDEDKWREKRHQWREAFIFRINEKKQKPRWYAGIDDFVRLSSGIVSNFLELCKMAFYMASWEGIDVKTGKEIPVRTQNEAVYKTSDAAFDWISKNIAITGPAVSRLIVDLGAVIRNKLLLHNSEPEASRITITDPTRLELEENELIRAILDDAVRWSVLQTEGGSRAYMPKHKEDVRPKDYLLNRLLHPTLKISINARWATRFTVNDLAKLANEDTRQRKRRDLLRKHAGNRPRVDASRQREFFDGEEE